MRPSLAGPDMSFFPTIALPFSRESSAHLLRLFIPGASGDGDRRPLWVTERPRRPTTRSGAGTAPGHEDVVGFGFAALEALRRAIEAPDPAPEHGSSGATRKRQCRPASSGISASALGRGLRRSVGRRPASPPLAQPRPKTADPFDTASEPMRSGRPGSASARSTAGPVAAGRRQELRTQSVEGAAGTGGTPLCSMPRSASRTTTLPVSAIEPPREAASDLPVRRVAAPVAAAGKCYRSDLVFFGSSKVSRVLLIGVSQAEDYL